MAPTVNNPWTPAQVRTLRRRYANTATADLVAVLGHPAGSIYNQAYKLGLHKAPAYFTEGDTRGVATRFKKGNVPWNKGQPYQAGGRSAETRFKPGRPASDAHNYLPIGSLRINHEGYLERKMTDDPSLAPVRRWTPIHRLVWEAANGPVPPSHVVAFKNNARTTVEAEITLDRLECVSRADMARRNHPRRRSPELGALYQLKGAIKRQLNRIIKETKA